MIVFFLFVGFLIPVPAVIVALAVKDYQYTIVQFPPSVCITKSGDLWFYSANLVIIIILAVTSCLLVITFWRVHIHKVQLVINLCD